MVERGVCRPLIREILGNKQVSEEHLQNRRQHDRPEMREAHTAVLPQHGQHDRLEHHRHGQQDQVIEQLRPDDMGARIDREGSQGERDAAHRHRHEHDPRDLILRRHIIKINRIAALRHDDRSAFHAAASPLDRDVGPAVFSGQIPDPETDAPDWPSVFQIKRDGRPRRLRVELCPIVGQLVKPLAVLPAQGFDGHRLLRILRAEIDDPRRVKGAEQQRRQENRKQNGFCSSPAPVSSLPSAADPSLRSAQVLSFPAALLPAPPSSLTAPAFSPAAVPSPSPAVPMSFFLFRSSFDIQIQIIVSQRITVPFMMTFVI